MAIYLKLGSINGDATHAEHKQWITVQQLNWGVGRAVTTPVGDVENREASEPSVSEVSIEKNMDNSSIYLFQEACTGNKGQDCTIHVVQTGSPGRLVLEYKLYDTLVSSYSASSTGDTPKELLGLNFTKIDMKYMNYDAAGTGTPATASYNLADTQKT